MSATRKLIIDRSRWLRGEDPSETFLLRPRDKAMCCLGFLAKEIGASDADIEGEFTPAERPELFEKAPWLLETSDPESGVPTGDFSHTHDCDLLIDANDDVCLSDAERETKISNVFSRHGWEVEFVDGPVKP